MPGLFCFFLLVPAKRFRGKDSLLSYPEVTLRLASVLRELLLLERGSKMLSRLLTRASAPRIAIAGPASRGAKMVAATAAAAFRNRASRDVPRAGPAPQPVAPSLRFARAAPGLRGPTLPPCAPVAEPAPCRTRERACTCDRSARPADGAARWRCLRCGVGPAALSSPAPEAEPEKEEPPAPPVKGSESAVGEAKSFGFQAETRQLLDIVQHSLYSDREVFLRELISNSCDALEKARHAMLTSQSAGDGEAELSISITVDPKERLLAIEDNGIGMTSDEVQEYLGTIARSGSKAFMEKLAEASDSSPSQSASSIIGKFGVGFYSVFMVSEKVEVYTCKRGETTGTCWTSTGDGSYTLSEATGVSPGTKIILHLKPDAENFAQESTVKTLIDKYSSFVSFPVMCHGKKV
jgi:hypothetical protein